MAARFINDVQIAKSHRDFQLKKAAYDKEVLTKKAASEMAYDLQVRFNTEWQIRIYTNDTVDAPMGIDRIFLNMLESKGH